MYKNQKMYDGDRQVCLFPLHSFIITQRDDETFSHNPGAYFASDYQAFNYNSMTVMPYQEYYAPCDVTCVGMDKVNASILWKSKEKVLMANGVYDYFMILFYHDNNIPNNQYNIGDIKLQGEVIGYTGTYGDNGSYVPNHVHIETGNGNYYESVYQLPNYGHINLEYAFHNYEVCFGNNIIDNGIISYPDKYPWIIYNSNNELKKFTMKKRKFKFYFYN